MHRLGGKKRKYMNNDNKTNTTPSLWARVRPHSGKVWRAVSPLGGGRGGGSTLGSVSLLCSYAIMR